MFYKFLNNRISKKISRLHPIAVKYLNNDIGKNNDPAIAERLEVSRNHALLHKHCEANQKRLYMINRNYLNFLNAIIYLYQTSQSAVSAGIFIAPSNIYKTIKVVQESFREMTKSLSLK